LRGSAPSFRWSTTLAQQLGPVPTIAKTLQNRVLDFARRTPFKELKVIFESSDRADPLIKQAFQDLAIEQWPGSAFRASRP